MVYLLFRTWRLNERHYGMLKQYTLWTVNDVTSRGSVGAFDLEILLKSCKSKFEVFFVRFEVFT